MKLPHKGSSELEQPFTSTASVAGCHSPVCQHLTAPDSPKSRFANFYRTNSPLTTDAKAIRTYTRRTYTHTRVVLFPCFQGPTPPAQGREHQLTDCGQSMHMKTAYIGHTHRPPCWRTADSASTRTTSPTFACPCLPVFEVDISTILQGRPLISTWPFLRKAEHCWG